MFISDRLGDSYKIWDRSTQVMITAPTGSGKTYFVINCLLPFAIEQEREILYISNRTLLDDEIVKAICVIQGVNYELMAKSGIAEFKGIIVMTYQTMQQMIKENGWSRQIPHCYYLVADEIHYIASDSEFSAEVYNAFKWLTNCDFPVKIMISATPEEVMPYFMSKDEGWQIQGYTDEFEAYIREPKFLINSATGILEKFLIYKFQGEAKKLNIFVYDEIEQITAAINKDRSDEKWLLFSSNKSKAKQKLIKNLTVDAAFISADEGNEEVKRSITSDNCYTAKVLVTTKVLDNGVSLHDSKIKNIVIEATNRTDFLQMLGRNRNQSGVCCNLYIPRLSAAYFSSMIRLQIEPALELFERTAAEVLAIALADNKGRELVRRFYRNEKGKLLLNPIAKDQMKKKFDFYKQMQEALKLDANAFVDMQLSWLENVEINIITYLTQTEKDNERCRLMDTLEEFADKSLCKEMQKAFRQKVSASIKVLLPNQYKNERMLGLKVLNNLFEKLHLGFYIEARGGKKKGEETTWKIMKE